MSSTSAFGLRQNRNYFFSEFIIIFLLGGAPILFTVELDDIWNPADKETFEVTSRGPNDCEFGPVLDGDFVRYHYNGFLPNGKPFHSSHEEGRTYDTYVGKGWLIKGQVRFSRKMSIQNKSFQ